MQTNRLEIILFGPAFFRRKLFVFGLCWRKVDPCNNEVEWIGLLCSGGYGSVLSSLIELHIGRNFQMDLRESTNHKFVIDP